MTKSSSCGIGGNSDILIGTVSGLRFGDIKISEPLTGFSRAKAGDLADTSYDGNIGAGVLRHFKIIFDYSRNRMILEPSS